MILSYKYRVYPDEDAVEKMFSAMNTHRIMWNRLLELCLRGYDEWGMRLPSKYDLRNKVILWRKRNRWLQKLNAKSLEITVFRLHTAFTTFFSLQKKGQKDSRPPRYKARDRFKTLSFQGVEGNRVQGIKLKADSIEIRGVGSIPIHMHREMYGVPKRATIRMQGAKWYVSISCDIGGPDPTIPTAIASHQGSAVGVDAGHKYYVATSDGMKIVHPRWYREAQKERKRLSRIVARRKPKPFQKGSLGYRKAKRALSVHEEKVASRRHDFQHKLARTLCERYRIIVLEKLETKKMSEDSRFSKGWADTGFSTFVSLLQQKAEMWGVKVLEVDPAYTSQMCSECGYIDRANRKTQSSFVCLTCGHAENADINAAKNILQRGIEKLQKKKTRKKPRKLVTI